jgi:predicted DNA-binding transcriptional regulator AlpA
VPKSRTANPANVRLPIGQVCRRYGITARTVSRWLDDEHLGFPRPFVIKRRRYWDEAMLATWDRQQVNRKSDRCDGAAAPVSSPPEPALRKALTEK